MRFEELKVGDKFIFDYYIEYDSESGEHFGRILFMKVRPVKDRYYSYNAIQYTGLHAGSFREIGRYDEVILVE